MKPPYMPAVLVLWVAHRPPYYLPRLSWQIARDNTGQQPLAVAAGQCPLRYIVGLAWFPTL